MFKIWDAKIKGKIKHKENGDVCDGCKIYTDIVLGDNVHIACNCVFVGKENVLIDDNSAIAPNTVFYTSMPNLKKNATNKYVEGHESISKPIYIGKNVFIGANSVIGCGVWIEDNTVIPPLSNIRPFTKVRREYTW